MRVLVVLLIGTITLSCRGPVTAAWRRAARYASHRDSDRHTRDAAARIGASTTSTRMAIARQGHNELATALKVRHGRRWRYRQPWLLLTGEDTTITSLLPSLAENGYLITDDVVVLREPRPIEEPPDASWLQQLARLRRRRPVDGVVLVVPVGAVGSARDASRDAPAFSATLQRIASTLHWSAPIYVLHVGGVHHDQSPVVGCEWAHVGDAEVAQADLWALRNQLAEQGVWDIADHPDDIGYTAAISRLLDVRSAPLANWLAALAARRLLLRGAFFAPGQPKKGERQPLQQLPIWPHLGALARRDRGRRVGFHPITVVSTMILALIGLWTCGMLISGWTNANALRQSQVAVQALDTGHDAARIRALLALQQRISLYEERARHHTPLFTRFGLNHDGVTLDILWQRYAPAARSLLTTPARLALEASLKNLGQMRADALQSHDAQRHGYDQLKTYLMLADPQRVDAPFLATHMTDAFPMVTSMPPGEWQDTSQRLAVFFANHLATHPDWRITPSVALITTARGTLINQIGLANADDTLYRAVMDGVHGKYADVSLPVLLNGTDAQDLFSTAASVPGHYTRAAWDGMIAEAIDKAASERHVQSDWVLTDGNAVAVPESDPSRVDDIKRRLTARYFAEYAAAWQHMLNSIQWQPAPNLNAAIDQLTRLTDAQTSPLIALMKSVQSQAQAGRRTKAIGDELVHRAQSLIGRKDEELASSFANPLDAAFGPLLALMGDSGGATAHDANSTDNTASLNGVSLQSYLTSATTMRLKLQQIGNSPDAQTMARALAQAVFQGKLSDLAQVREQAALTAASLGSAWSGFGDALFARPLDGAWQTILQPAAASLNELWRASLAMPFNSAFDGRYPFYDTNADASFAELGRYVKPSTGLIARFLTVELAGVLTQQGDQWVPNGLAPQTLAFDPTFLAAMQQMSVLGARLYAQGDAGYHFEVMPQPTPNVTRSQLTVDKQQVVYFNQQETWSPIAWPGDGLNGHTALTWQTLDAGVRQAFDETGDWAFLRLLAKAKVKPLDSTRYELTWVQPDAEPLRYVLRTHVGDGPLDLLKLRGFKLPERIFISQEPSSVARNNAGPSTLPLPMELTAP
ncbi:ImcF-related family protein [Dyella monticola]|uniref:ImcF-related family protein n=1 Tax=Dyella monticola TaxID=1927958 RepID=UPI00131426C1|nr:ImcF-related family protein [Dyella monticola]